MILIFFSVMTNKNKRIKIKIECIIYIGVKLKLIFNFIYALFVSNVDFSLQKSLIGKKKTNCAKN